MRQTTQTERLLKSTWFSGASAIAAEKALIASVWLPALKCLLPSFLSWSTCGLEEADVERSGKRDIGDGEQR
jgi:hypothetical protein